LEEEEEQEEEYGWEDLLDGFLEHTLPLHTHTHPV